MSDNMCRESQVGGDDGGSAGDGIVTLRFGNLKGEVYELEIETELLDAENSDARIVRLSTCQDGVRQIIGDERLPVSCLLVLDHQMRQLPEKIQLADLPNCNTFELVADGAGDNNSDDDSDGLLSFSSELTEMGACSAVEDFTFDSPDDDITCVIPTGGNCVAPSVHFHYVIKVVPPEGIDLGRVIKVRDLPMFELWLYYADSEGLAVELAEAVLRAAWLEFADVPAVADMNVLMDITINNDTLALTGESAGSPDVSAAVQPVFDELNKLIPQVLPCKHSPYLDPVGKYGDAGLKRIVARTIFEHAQWEWIYNLNRLANRVKPVALARKLLYAEVSGPNTMGLVDPASRALVQLHDFFGMYYRTLIRRVHGSLRPKTFHRC